MLTCLIIAIEIILGLLLQTTVFIHFEVANIVPDLLMIITVACGYQFGKLQGMATGFICGILLDITYGSVMGVYALFFLLIGYMNGLLKPYFIEHDFGVPLLLIPASEFFYTLLFYIFEFFI